MEGGVEGHRRPSECLFLKCWDVMFCFCLCPVKPSGLFRSIFEPWFPSAAGQPECRACNVFMKRERDKEKTRLCAQMRSVNDLVGGFAAAACTTMARYRCSLRIQRYCSFLVAL